MRQVANHFTHTKKRKENDKNTIKKINKNKEKLMKKTYSRNNRNKCNELINGHYTYCTNDN